MDALLSNKKLEFEKMDNMKAYFGGVITITLIFFFWLTVIALMGIIK